MWILVEFSMFVVSELCLRRINIFCFVYLYGFAIRIPYIIICLIRIYSHCSCIYQYRNFVYLKSKSRDIRARIHKKLVKTLNVFWRLYFLKKTLYWYLYTNLIM